MAERRLTRGSKRKRGKLGSPGDQAGEKDLAFVVGRSEDGEALHVLRRRAATGLVETGLVRPLREGHAITGEVVQLEPREESPLLFDCETDRELSAPTSEAGGGPPQVASNEYRRGWDAIWGGRGRSTAVN
jgi:hypothetical protein